jgi:hypothetical protein
MHGATPPFGPLPSSEPLSDSGVPRDRAAAYVRRAEVLRQIHGNKASRAQRWEIAYLVVTVVVATVVTAVGFAGSERIADWLPSSPVPGMDNVTAVDLVFNLAVLLILVLTLIGLIYRNGERANRHFRSVEVLTEFIRDWEDQIALHDAELATIGVHQLAIAGERYKGLLGALPSSTDREYLKAKKDFKKKQEAREALKSASRYSQLSPSLEAEIVASQEPPRQERLYANTLASIIQGDPDRLSALQAVSGTLGQDGWVVGGFIREAVWDKLQGHRELPSIGEIDVIYYDPRDTERSAERRIRDQLHAASSDIAWSVKNQARMHTKNGHEPYSGVADALSRAPESATAVAVQLHRGQLRVLAPLGLSDLFEMRLLRNPRASEEAYRRRLPKVQQTNRWPSLRVDNTAQSVTVVEPD